MLLEVICLHSHPNQLFYISMCDSNGVTAMDEMLHHDAISVIYTAHLDKMWRHYEAKKTKNNKQKKTDCVKQA